MEKPHAAVHSELAGHVAFHEARLGRLVALEADLASAQKVVAGAQAEINEIVAKSVKAKSVKAQAEIAQAEADLTAMRVIRATATARLERLQRIAAEAVAEAGAESFKDLLRLVASFGLCDQALLDEARAKSRALAKAADRQAESRRGDAVVAATLAPESARRLGFRGRVLNKDETVETLHIEGRPTSEPAPVAPAKPVPNRQANGWDSSRPTLDLSAPADEHPRPPNSALKVFFAPHPTEGKHKKNAEKAAEKGKGNKPKSRPRGEKELHASKA